MATKDARRDAALRAVSILVDLATTTDLRPAEARALTAALTALGELRVERAAAHVARAGQRLVNDLASVYAAVAEEARVAEKRRASARKGANRSPDPGKSALRFGRTEGAEARLGRTVFEAVSDAIGDWARDTGDLNHEATTQWALEELELDAAEIKKLKGPLNAAATVVGRLGIVPHSTTFDRRRKGIQPLRDPEKPANVVGMMLRRLRQIEFMLMSQGFSERTARVEALRLLRLRRTPLA